MIKIINDIYEAEERDFLWQLSVNDDSHHIFTHV